MAAVTIVSNDNKLSKCCSECNVLKLFREFHNKKCSEDDYHSLCKECRKSIEKQSISQEENRQPIIFINGEPMLCEELSLPELKALQKHHNIILNGHYNKAEFVEWFKQRGVLPPGYTVGRRRVKNPKPVSEPDDKPKIPKLIPTAKIREHC